MYDFIKVFKRRRLLNLFRDLVGDGKDHINILFKKNTCYAHISNYKEEDLDKINLFTKKCSSDFLLKKVRIMLSSPQEKQKINNHCVEKKKIPGTKKVILVLSGKGGTGKTTIAVNIASMMVKEGFKTGIVDMDLAGPSVINMLSSFIDQNIFPGKEFTIPGVCKNNMKFFSAGALMSKKALLWRGPMLSKFAEQFIFSTKWEDVDFLIIDMPPGTGDMHLTILNKLDVDGAIIVTTASSLAIDESIRTIDMLNTFKTPILGIVENMSGSENMQSIFNNSLLSRLPEDIEKIESVPLSENIARSADNGIPFVNHTESELHNRFKTITNFICKKTYDL